MLITTKQLHYEGYTYSVKDDRSAYGGKIYWKCIKATHFKCKATAQSNGDKENIKLGAHGHSHEKTTTAMANLKHQKQQIVHNLKTKARNCLARPSNVSTQVTAACSTELLEVLPTKDSLRRLVAKNRTHPPAPKDIHFTVR